MIFIISLIVTFLALLLSAYFFYFYLKPKKDPLISSKSTVTKHQAEPSATQSKKSKKQKKSQKSEIKVAHEEVTESINEVQTDENVNTETLIAPVISIPQESAISTDVLNRNLSEIEYLKTEIKKFEDEKQTLNYELEEAQERIAKYREDTEKLAEENKTIKSNFTKLERSKAKTDEHLRTIENSNAESIAKIEEIERKLTQNNSENVELKQKFEISSQKLHKSKIELKSEQEKLKLVQCEKDNAIKNQEEITRKFNELFEKNKSDNSNHVEMYRQYEHKISQINNDYKQVKIETVNLNNLLQAKEKEINNLNKELNNLNIQLTKSKEENHNLSFNFNKISKDLNSRESQTSQISNENRRLSEDLDNLKTEISFTKVDNELKLKKMSEDLKEKDAMLHDLENDKSLMEEEIDRLRKEFENLREINEKTLSNVLESKANLEETNRELHKQIEIAKKEFTDENIKLMNEIERLQLDCSDKIGIFNDKSCLQEEITLLKTSCSNKEEELSKLHAISEELKEKNNDLRVLQDQKMDFLKEIDHLKKEINSRDFSNNEKVIELSQSVKTNEIVISELLNEKKQLEKKLEDLKKSIGEREIYFQNSKPKVEFEELSKKLEQKNEELLKVQHEKRELKSEINKANEYYKRQMADLNENLERKIKELDFQNDFCIAWKDKCEQLEKMLQEALNSNRQVESIIQETRVEPIESFASSCRTAEEMKSHIVKLESELLALQRKYYELKTTAIASNDIPESNSKSPANVNIYQSDIISIPPADATIEAETISDIKIDQSYSASHLLDSIEKLNIEISEQRLKNQTLDKQSIDKNIEVNALKQCLYGLDGDLLSIEHLALDLQKSFSESSSEKNKLKTDYNKLMKEHESVKAKYDSLAEEFYVLRNATEIQDNNETIQLLEEQLKRCQEENYHLKIQLDHYRETLEKTENCLQNIQASVDQEENNWKICLKSSEQEQERLEEKIKELLNQIEELRTKQQSDSPTMISMETPPIANGSLSSETKKKRKRKNRKKKNKNRVTQQ